VAKHKVTTFESKVTTFESKVKMPRNNILKTMIPKFKKYELFHNVENESGVDSGRNFKEYIHDLEFHQKMKRDDIEWFQENKRRRRNAVNHSSLTNDIKLLIESTLRRHEEALRRNIEEFLLIQ